MSPLALLLTIVSVALLFALVTENGTSAAIAEKLLSRLGSRMHLAPLALFVITAVISAAGAGNITATLLIAPLAMRFAARIGLSPFLTTLLVIGGANAGSLSPVSMTGILARELLSGPQWSEAALTSLSWRMFLTVFGSVTALQAIGFLIFGGYAWLRAHARKGVAKTGEPRLLNRAQLVTTLVVAMFSVLVLATPLSPGLIAAVAAIVLISSRLASLQKALRLVPWKSVALIAVMLQLAHFAERFGWVALAASQLSQMGTPASMPIWIALIAAALSTVSSSSGVVLPLLLPMIPAFAAAGADPGATAVAVVLGSHLVDCSPLSSLGAMCLGAVHGESRKQERRLFVALLAWGLAMVPVSGLIAAML